MKPTFRSTLAVALLLSTTTAFSQNVTLQEFETDSGTTGSKFGAAVAATSKFLYASAPGFDRGGFEDSGAVFSFTLKTLTQYFRLATPTSFKQQEGSRLASTKAELLIGYPAKYINSAANAGEVVYYNEKQQVPVIFNSLDPVPNDRFGDALAMSSKLIVIGAPGEQDGPNSDHTGAAFAIVKKVPSNLIRLPLPHFIDGEKTGAAVAVSTKFIIVGAPYADDEVTSAQGKVYVYDAKTFGRIRTLNKPESASPNAHFGTSVVFAGTSLFVGAPGAEAGTGMVYQFDTKTFSFIRAISSSALQQDSDFGSVLAGDKKYLVVGSPLHQQGGAEGGIAEVYDVKTGALVDTLESPSPEAGEHFGAALTVLKGGRVAVGAPAPDSLSNDGHVYVQTIVPAP
jgi:hypothetical protein